MNKTTDYQWTFPCSLPIKIMGPARATLKPLALSIIQQHVPDYSGSNLCETCSKTGKYISLTATIEFQNKTQIDALFAELAHHQQLGDDILFVI